jgi:hypothetical protein
MHAWSRRAFSADHDAKYASANLQFKRQQHTAQCSTRRNAERFTALSCRRDLPWECSLSPNQLIDGQIDCSLPRLVAELPDNLLRTWHGKILLDFLRACKLIRYRGTADDVRALQKSARLPFRFSWVIRWRVPRAKIRDRHHHPTHPAAPIRC